MICHSFFVLPRICFGFFFNKFVDDSVQRGQEGNVYLYSVCMYLNNCKC